MSMNNNKLIEDLGYNNLGNDSPENLTYSKKQLLFGVRKFGLWRIGLQDFSEIWALWKKRKIGL